jgi:hypothetical protein
VVSPFTAPLEKGGITALLTIRVIWNHKCAKPREMHSRGFADHDHVRELQTMADQPHPRNLSGLSTVELYAVDPFPLEHFFVLTRPISERGASLLENRMRYDARVASIPLPETAIESARAAVMTHNASFPPGMLPDETGIYADVLVDGTQVLRLWVYYRRRIRSYAHDLNGAPRMTPTMAEPSLADFFAVSYGCKLWSIQKAVLHCAWIAKRDRDTRPYYATLRRALYEWRPEIYWHKNLKRMMLIVLDAPDDAPPPLVRGQINSDPHVTSVRKKLEAWLSTYAQAHGLVGAPAPRKRGRPYTTHATRGIAEIVVINGIDQRYYGNGWATPADLAGLDDLHRPLSKEQDSWQCEITRQKYNKQRRIKYARNKQVGKI